MKSPGMIRLHTIIFGAVTALTFMAVEGRTRPKASGGAGNGRASEFELKDQYGKSFTYRFPKAKVSILAFADRKGSEQLEGWIRPLYERYQDRVDIQGVASLSSVPPFVRPVVRRIFRSKVNYSVMLDWQGDVTARYGCEEAKANIFLIEKNGDILLKLTGEATSPGLAHLYRRVDDSLRP